MCSNGYANHLKELIDEGVFNEERLDEAVLKVLELKNKLGLFEDPYHGASIEREAAECLRSENLKVARAAANESAVLLKNDGILPLSKDIKKIALIGPYADNHHIQGQWSCQGRSCETITVKQGIENLLPNVEVNCVIGCSNEYADLDKNGFAEAIFAARNADAVILCLGEPQNYTGEGNSRADLDLPGVQNELAERVIEANANTVAVIFAGRPLVLTKLHNLAPAILDMWFPGNEGGNSVADLIFGNINPSGKLSMSFPKAVGQCPIYYNRLNTGRPKSIENDDKHIIYQSNYVDCGNLPLYSFGYGLSYSEFVYENMELSKNELSKDDKIKVRITILNDSKFKGKEVVMLYMHDLVASTERPIQQLIAFKKVDLNRKKEYRI